MKKSFQKSVAFVLTGAMTLSMAQIGAVPTKAQETLTDTEASADERVTQFMDCMEPMPIVGELSDSCWGAAQVGARDQDNGLEDRTLENYCYWDGGILKDEETGKYYMFASRWNQAGGHWGQDNGSGWVDGWQGSQAIYAVSDNLYGPYTDMGPIWPDWCEGAGHNVFPFELSESDPLYEEGYRYAISISDTGKHGDVANGTIHISKSLEGPWELIENGNSGKLKAEGEFGLSNISIMVRPDGRYEATNRNGDIALADSVAGTWEVVENGLWWQIENMSPDNVEDPVIWYSDGLYHIVANKWDARMSYYLTSEDGVTNWTRHPGTAYTPLADFLEYEDGTMNRWTKLERPNIYVEDGEIKAMTFAVIDVQKEEDFGNDQHGSKIIVVPFSSEKLQQLDAQPDPLENRTGDLPEADATAQTWGDEEWKNYGAEAFLQLQKDPAYDSQNGRLGEGTKPYSNYDNKIAYMKYDLSQYEIADADQIESATLSLVYKGRADGSAESTRIEAVLADSDWVEGTGCESVNNNWTEGMNWNTQPSLSYNEENAQETIAKSDEFYMADLQRVVELDVTKLVQQFVKENPGEEKISFALNVTSTGSRFQIYSREGEERLAPRLTVNVKEPEEPTDPDLTLEEAIKKAQEAQAKAEAAQKEAEEAKAEAERAKADAEAFKEQAEAARDEAEQAKKEAEDAIIQAGEDSKAAQEAMRTAAKKAAEAETAKQAAEAAQAAAETAKAEAEAAKEAANELLSTAKALAEQAEQTAAEAEAAKKEAEAERLAAEVAKKEAEAERLAAEAAMQAAKEERLKAEEAKKAAEAAKAEALRLKEELEKAQKENVDQNTQDSEQTEKVKKTALKSVKSQKKGKLKVTWKKVEGTTGYEIVYSRNAKFKNAVTKKVSAKKTSLQLKKLKSKKNYYVKVRAVKKTQSGTVYGAYSKAVKTKVK